MHAIEALIDKRLEKLDRKREKAASSLKNAKSPPEASRKSPVPD